jgi:hypothetical protein
MGPPYAVLKNGLHKVSDGFKTVSVRRKKQIDWSLCGHGHVPSIFWPVLPIRAS